jgi:hypothetical protein
MAGEVVVQGKMNMKLTTLLIAATATGLFAADGPASAVATFESIGLYYNRPGCQGVQGAVSRGIRAARSRRRQMARRLPISLRPARAAIPRIPRGPHTGHAV